MNLGALRGGWRRGNETNFGFEVKIAGGGVLGCQQLGRIFTLAMLGFALSGCWARIAATPPDGGVLAL
jgi:hypothetical protein